MIRLLRPLVIALAVLLAGPALAGSSFATLVQRLRHGEDFRVRVQAALQLGKSHNKRARVPLQRALDDPNAAVRAASAAALKVLGDKRAIHALKEHRLDPSAAVRSQIKASIRALKLIGQRHEKPKVLVKLGRIHASVRYRRLLGEVKRTSRAELDELPGVRVLDDSDDYKAAAKRRKPPVVMVTGRLRRLRASRQGGSVIYSAKMEYVMHRMPEQAIAGTVSGSASTRASAAEARDRRRVAELQHAVLMAAIESAIRRAPAALLEAAR